VRPDSELNNVLISNPKRAELANVCFIRIPLQDDTKSHSHTVGLVPDAAHEQLKKGASLRGVTMTSIQQLACARPSTRNCTYNLFQNNERPEIVCAVPEDRPVPGFLVLEQWTFGGTLRPSDARPPGFTDAAASVGVRFNGFYLFQVTDVHRKMAA
jgi:hypothetical protein